MLQWKWLSIWSNHYLNSVFCNPVFFALVRIKFLFVFYLGTTNGNRNALYVSMNRVRGFFFLSDTVRDFFIIFSPLLLLFSCYSPSRLVPRFVASVSRRAFVLCLCFTFLFLCFVACVHFHDLSYEFARRNWSARAREQQRDFQIVQSRIITAFFFSITVSFILLCVGIPLTQIMSKRVISDGNLVGKYRMSIFITVLL